MGFDSELGGDPMQELKLETNESIALGPNQSGELPVKKLIKKKKLSEQIEKPDEKVTLRVDPRKITRANEA